ncbi:ClpP-like prohead protease/major capsid protein fusion protein [Alcanivorax sp.]|jgi:ATP-dependent protease ClpP protease subunit|uniref:ClpP-like prohead protease/major capsid protein fusion protein n=1 Tax=Alcanivorax sp. TaxID=1872427 RepID=UPI0032D8BAC6
MPKWKLKALAQAVNGGLALSATNQINAKGELLLYGVIGDWWDGLDAMTIVREVEALNDGPLSVRIHSEGGFITEGLAIYNALANSERRVEVTIDGIALSMASVIAMAGDVVRIPANAFIMIHKPSGPSLGEADDHRRTADVYDQFEDTLANIYATKTGLDKDTLKAMMAAETWLNGEQAVELGFADELIEPVQAVAQADLAAFQNAPAGAVNLYHRPASGQITAATAAAHTNPKGTVMNLEQRAKAVGLSRHAGETNEQLEVRVAAAEAKAQAAAAAGGGEEEEEPPLAAAGAQNRGTRNDPPPVPAAAAQNAGEVATQAIAQERTRVSELRALAATHRVEEADLNRMIDTGTTVADARNEVLNLLATRSQNAVPGGHVVVGHHGEALRAGLAGALMNRVNPSQHPLTDGSREFRSMSLMNMAAEVIHAGGGSTRGMTPMEIAAKAMHSTSDFPAILADVANKTLRAGYEAAPRTFTAFCRQASASDFKFVNRAQLGEAPELEKVNESGEFNYGSMGEDNQRYKLETYGKIIALTRQTIINDDLDAFSRVPGAFGASAAELESNVVWGLITGNVKMADNKALFHNDHGNLGTAAALSVESLSEARKKMRRQTGISAKRPLNLMAEYLVVPAALETKAQQIVAEILSAKSADVNPFAGKLQVVVEPRLDDSSETAWYLSAAPARIDTIEYAYLTGEEGVYIETENGFDVDGVKIKARLDFGAGVIDHRGLFKNAGA